MISDSIIYTDIAGSKQLHTTFRFEIPAPKYAGEYGFISFDRFGQVTVREGFAWDGASGPTIDTIDTVCAALGHDVMYRLMGQRLLPSSYKEFADKWFYDRLIKDGVLSYRAFAWYKAVQLFGIPKHSAESFKRAPTPFTADAIEVTNNPLIGRPD